MRIRIILICILGTVLFTLPALSAEVVRFKSGTALIIDKHRVEGNTVYVTIGSGSEIAFPLSLVDTIEPKDRISGSDDLIFNRQSSGTTGGDFHGVEAAEGGSWSTGYDSLSQFRPGSRRRDAGEQPAYTVPAYSQSQSHPAQSKVKIAINPALRRKESAPRNTGEVGSAGQQTTLSVPIRRGATTKGQVTEIQPKLRSE